MQYRKKPVVIDAVQYTEYGKLVKGMCNSRSCYTSGNTKPHVHTIHASQIVLLEVGDWILPEPDGKHYYPCKPDIFAETYEPVDSTPAPTDQTLDDLEADNWTYHPETSSVFDKLLVRFACAFCDEEGVLEARKAIHAHVTAKVEEEREACARIADCFSSGDSLRIGNNIRARSHAPERGAGG